MKEICNFNLTNQHVSTSFSICIYILLSVKTFLTLMLEKYIYFSRHSFVLSLKLANIIYQGKMLCKSRDNYQKFLFYSYGTPVDIILECVWERRHKHTWQYSGLTYYWLYSEITSGGFSNIWDVRDDCKEKSLLTVLYKQILFII